MTIGSCRCRRIRCVQLALLLWAVAVSGCGMCGNRLLNAVNSVDGRFKAVVFDRTCGAMTGTATNVSILSSGDDLPNDKGNIAIATGSGPSTNPVETVELHWLSSRELLIEYTEGADFSRRVTNSRGVSIIYKAIPRRQTH